MKNIKFKIKSYIDYLTSLTKFTLFKYDLNKINVRKKIKVSNFNKYLIFLISALFMYLFYLSIPSLYDIGKLQIKLSQKLESEYKLNISSSSKILYSILPYPNILIEDAKLFNNDKDNPLELGQIKELRIFISQKNLFSLKNIEIKNIIINKANFSIQSKNIDYFNNYIAKKFSKKKLNIKKSNIFLRKNNQDIISIILIKNLDLFFNENKVENEIKIEGEIFKLPFITKWNKNFVNEKKSQTFFKIKKLLFNLHNTRNLENEKYTSLNKINIRNLKLLSKIEIVDKSIIFKSQDTTNQIKKLDYTGHVNLDPFELKLNINLKEIDQKRIAYLNHFFEELLNTGLIFNKNLNSKISINAKNFKKNKLINSIKLNLNINNGRLNLNNTKLISDNVGNIILNNSEFKQEQGEIIFFGNFNFAIDNQSEFYKKFQTSKINRKLLKNIKFSVEYNMFREELEISSFVINDNKKNKNNSTKQFLENFNSDKKNKIDNWIDLKTFINQIMQTT